MDNTCACLLNQVHSRTGNREPDLLAGSHKPAFDILGGFAACTGQGGISFLFSPRTQVTDLDNEKEHKPKWTVQRCRRSRQTGFYELKKLMP